MLDEYLAVAIEAARAGAAQLEAWRARFGVREKGRADLVTDADLAAQAAVRDVLLGRFPDHGFLGEESTERPAVPGPNAPPLWVVDPLDGTTNYVHDCPMYCVSIGLMVAGEVAVGVVFDPRGNEMFAAAKGQGVTLNGTPIRTSAAATLGQSLLASGFTADVSRDPRQLQAWDRLSHMAQSLRRTGSTALNLAYVAAGRFDGFWAYANHPWDVAGGIALVREAGGVVTGLDGVPHDTFRPEIVASNRAIHAALVGELAAVAPAVTMESRSPAPS